MRRRDFLGTAAGTAAAALASGSADAAGEGPAGPGAAGRVDREYWVGVAARLSSPVLTNLAAGTLKARMPVEEAAGAGRRSVTHLEALGRLLAGIAPWLELPADGSGEGLARARHTDLALRAVDRAVDPSSPDALNFTENRQPLVDAAFLAQGLLRAPRALGGGFGGATRTHLVRALASTRAIQPGFNNWLLFSATVEAGLAALGAPWDRMRVDYALRQHGQWYKGDGVYGDGPAFHFDYYNSFVIHPMLLDVLEALGEHSEAWKAMRGPALRRAQRYAAIQERLVSPEGTFPPVGRSIAYRFGAFHALAQTALRRELPAEVAPAQVRGALTAVIRRSIEAPGTFDADGWLRIGFAGHQPGVGERYISTGSLYLCAVGLLPLGLPPGDPFWADPATPWTAQRAWSGQPFAIDKALSD
ncbi:MAG TPA: DUF2264 domain-containing protein [Vicinamibacteria bacterium]|nr:DUF2264 domain-containing protein [Vicinamibacteria bacterium]